MTSRKEEEIMTSLRILLGIFLSITMVFASDMREEKASNRTYFSKTYSVGDNRYKVEIASKPIHYKDENGNFVDIPVDDNGEIYQIALEQLDDWYDFEYGSYKKIIRSTGTTYDNHTYFGYIGNYNFFDYEDAEAFYDSNYNDIYEAGIDSFDVSVHDLNDNEQWDDKVDNVIWRYYSVFSNSVFDIPQASGDVIYEGLDLDLGYNRDSAYPITESSFGTVKVRAGHQSGTFPSSTPEASDWSTLGSFGSEIESFDPGFIIPDTAFQFSYDTSSTMFTLVKDILDGGSADLQFVAKKSSESFQDSADWYIALNSAVLTLSYRIERVTLTNIAEDSLNANLGGKLSLYKGTERDSVSSGDSLEVTKGLLYTAQTHHHTLTSKRHRAWNDNSDHLIFWTNFEMDQDMADDGIIAKFKSREEIDLSNCLISGVMLHDPWYVQNEGTTDYDSWIQPDTFISVPTLTTNGDYNAFLGQTYSSSSYYSLSAPQVVEESANEYNIFNQWQGSGLNYNGQSTTINVETPVTFAAPNAEPIPDYNTLHIGTGVNFTQSGDTLKVSAKQFYYSNNNFYEFSHWSGDSITLGSTTAYTTTIEALSGESTVNAVYNTTTPANSVQNKTIYIRSGEQIDIPAAADITFASGVTIDMAGSLNVNGTLASPVIFESSGKQSPFPSAMTEHPSAPLDKLVKITGDEASCEISYLELSDAYCGISIEGDAANVLIENSIFTDLNYALNVEPVEDLTLEITGCTFTGLDNGIVYSNNINNPDVDTENLIFRNEFSNIDDRAIFIRLESEESGNNSVNMFAIRANTFYNNGTGIYCQRESGSNYSEFGDVYLYVTNNIFSESTNRWLEDNQVIFFEGTDGDESEGNLFHNSGGTYYMGSTTTDVRFIDTTNIDLRLQHDSPAIDAGLDTYWIPEFPDLDDYEDPDGTDLDIGAYYCPQDTVTSALTISSNTEWYGIYKFASNVTISSGATLTITPGSRVQFPDLTSGYPSFSVYGNLVADGTSEAPILFTSSDPNPAKKDWYGIRVYSTINPNITVIDNCIIEYSYLGIYLSGASIDVTNNISQNNYYGLQVRSGANPTVTSNEFISNTYGTYVYLGSGTYTNNLIKDNSSRGMYFSGTSTPRLISNTVDNNGSYGVYMYNHADVQFGNQTGGRGYNEVINNSSIGIYANNYCDPFLGTTDAYNNQLSGSNSIHGNGTDNIRAVTSSNIDAQWNYWGDTTDYYIDGTSSIDFDHTLANEPSDALLGSSLAKGNGIDGYLACPDYDFFNPDTSSECALWHWAHDLRITNQLPVALWAWELFVSRFPDSELAQRALIKRANFSPDSEWSELATYLTGVLENSEYSDELRVKALELLAGINVKMLQYTDAYECAVELLEQSTCDDQEKVALYCLIDLSQNEGLGKSAIAANYYSQLAQKYPGDDITMQAAELLGEDVDWSTFSIGDENLEILAPEKYALYNAYPNPFNPTTTIRYDLPKETQVHLTVYDITGRLVTTLVSRNQVGGSYEVQWNGIDANGNSLPSGLYLYRLQAGSFVANEKMLLLK